MNSFLISLGATIVLVLTAALVGPSFVDWNAYRAAAEAEAARVVGLPVEIRGNLDVSILPAPVVQAGNVRVVANDVGEPLVEASAVRMSLSLGALVIGRLEITELALVEPRLRIDRLVAGAVELDRAPGPVNAGAASDGILRRLDATNASVVFEDPLDGRERTVSGIEFTVTTTSLDGPFKINGSFGGEPSTFSISVGSLAGAAPVKLAGRLGLADFGDVELNGEVVSDGGGPRFDGSVRFTRTLGDGRDGGKFLVETVAEIEPGQATLTELEIASTRGVHALSIGGGGRVAWHRTPEFNLELSARQVDLDGFLGADGEPGEAAAPDEIGEMIGRLGEFLVEHEARGKIQLAVDGAVWRDELARDVAATVEWAPDAMTITSLRGQLPGETELSMTGRVSLGDAPNFAGDLVVDTLEAERLTAWIAPNDAGWLAALLANSRGKLSVRARAKADAATIAFEAIDGFVDGNPFSGALALERGDERHRLRADLAFDLLDLNRYLPAEARPADLLTVASAEPAGARVFPDLAIELEAKRLAFQGREAEGVSLAAQYADGEITVDRFEVEHFVGSSLSASGHVTPTGEGPLGALDITVETESLPRLADALQIPVGELEGAFEPRLETADLLVALAVMRASDGQKSTVSVSGDLAGVGLDATAEAYAPLARIGEVPIRVTAVLDAEEAGDLFGAQGIIPVLGGTRSEGVARISLEATGMIADELDTRVSAEAFGATLAADGRLDFAPAGFTGEARLTAADSAKLAVALGLAGTAQTAGARTDVVAQVAMAEPTIRLEPIEGMIAGGAVKGTVAVTRGAPPHIDIDLVADDGSLPAVAGALFAASLDADGAAPTADVAPRRSAWPTELIEVGILDAATLEAKGAFASLAIADGFAIADAVLEARLADGKLMIDRLEGSLGSGRIEAQGTIAGVDHAMVVDGRIKLAGVPLDRLLADSDGRRLVGGRLTLDAEVSARGRSLLSLASSFAGSGTATIEGAAVPRFDAGAVFDLGQIASSDAEIIAVLVGGWRERTALGTLSGPLEAANGRLRVGPMRVATDAVAGEATSFVDVASRRFDQEIVLSPNAAPDGVKLALIHAGAFGRIGREAEITNLPQLGTVRWTEPDGQVDGDDALPPAAPEPAPAGPDADAGADAPATPEPAGTPEVAAPVATVRDTVPQTTSSARQAPPPTGLIEQRVLDLPILEEISPGDADGGSG